MGQITEVGFDAGRFRERTIRAIGAIILFVVVYLLLVLFAFSLMAVVTYLSIDILLEDLKEPKLGLIGGLMVFGGANLYYLVRALFESKKEDLSWLQLVTAEEEPRLFALITETANEVGSSHPKQVYFSTDIQASVFYNAGFWGMFFPPRKNLSVGLGLLECLTVSELKAVLAHEFAHFSQRTMRLQGYVYQANHILFNVVFQEPGKHDFFDNLAKLNWGLDILVKIFLSPLHAMRWILRRVYKVVNLSYLALAREMEFHADMVATHATDSKTTSSALLRMPLAVFAEGAVFSFYNNRISKGIKTENLYPQLGAAIRFLGKVNQMDSVGELPLVPLGLVPKFNRSKLVVNKQWESHPRTIDRVDAILSYSVTAGEDKVAPAVSLLDHAEKWQKAATTKLFERVNYERATTSMGVETFMAEVEKEHQASLFDPIYNGYYDDKMPIEFDVDAAIKGADWQELHVLFSDEVVENIYELFALSNDIALLKEIGEAGSGIKTFDYDGQRYRHRDVSKLQQRLEKQEKDLIDFYKSHDTLIFQAALAAAKAVGGEDELVSGYKALFQLVKDRHIWADLGRELHDALGFISQRIDLAEAQSKMKDLKEVEGRFRDQLTAFLKMEDYAETLDEEEKEAMSTYLERDHQYLVGNSYDDDALSIMYAALDSYNHFLSDCLSSTRRRLAKMQASIFHAKMDLY